MAIVKPFKGLRTPNQEVCEELACLPYDVMNSEEAAQMAAGKPKSLLHVTRAEIDCPAGTDIHSEEVYNKSVENFKMFQEGEDFTSVVGTTVVNNGAVREIQDYAVTLRMAEHLAMMSKTPKGYEVREYFIQVEKDFNSPEKIMARALRIADNKIHKL